MNKKLMSITQIKKGNETNTLAQVHIENSSDAFRVLLCLEDITKAIRERLIKDFGEETVKEGLKLLSKNGLKYGGEF